MTGAHSNSMTGFRTGVSESLLRMVMPILRLLVLVPLLGGCGVSPSTEIASTSESPRLPTGGRLDPAGRQTDVGSLPLALILSRDGRRIVLILNGHNDQGVQIIDRATGQVTQTLVQPAAFLGLVFSPDGRRLYASGGNEDVVYAYNWADGAATLADTFVLARKEKTKSGTRYPGGIGISPDGKTLYVAENLADSLAVVDVATRQVKRRFATEPYPYGVVVAPDGTVYVSAWGGSTVSVFTPSGNGITDAGRIPVGRHPSALLLNRDGSRLFAASGTTDRIAAVDTRTRRVIVQLLGAPPAGPSEGSTPNALALSPDGRRLFVAEADNNAVGVFDLSAQTSGVSTATGNDELAGRIPTGWYPAAVAATRDSLFVANAKGRGAGPNPNGPDPIKRPGYNPRQYTLAQLSGTMMMIDAARATGAELTRYSARVAHANGWNVMRTRPAYPPIEHVIYIIKENRTYDQVFGDLRQADGDTSLLFFPRPVSPNHHALAERFGIFDRFFVNAEVSPDGHNWSTAAYTSDYVQKTVPSNYSSRGRTYDYEGNNRDKVPDDDVAAPSTGYLWDLADKPGITFRNYGEFVDPFRSGSVGSSALRYRANKRFLAAHTNEHYPGFDMDITDQHRADIWIAELQQFERDGQMPALEIVRLPNDHTSGASAGSPTPRAYMADNDLALGRMIEALSKTRFWKSTAVFVLEDDAQNGSDHVDSHRSIMLVISPWSRGGIMHRFTNTTDVIATIEELLKLGTMSQFDHFGRPLRDFWALNPDSSPYTALVPAVSLDERNPRVGIGAEDSKKLALDKEDIADEELFNRILWRAIKGEARPWPGVKRMSTLDLLPYTSH
jgi:YVTN family beta-propeller protein